MILTFSLFLLLKAISVMKCTVSPPDVYQGGCRGDEGQAAASGTCLSLLQLVFVVSPPH